MIDYHKRTIDYVRISLTDRCNLRCGYCMPQGELCFLPQEELLTLKEIEQLAKIFIEMGIVHFKLTGGEPLLRKDLVSIVKKLKAMDGCESVSLTTNGIYLEEHLEGLKEAKLDGINISLDTLNPKRYQEITGFDGVSQVKSGIKKALDMGCFQLKINFVPMGGVNDMDILDVIEYFKDEHISIRFIEMMPIGYGKQFTPIPQDKLIQKIQKKYGAYAPFDQKIGNGPATYYQWEAIPCKIGFISAVSHKFCESCNRFRVSSNGWLKTCLQYESGLEMKNMLQDDNAQELLKEKIYTTIYEKPKEHSFGEGGIFGEEDKMMFQIGG